MAGKLDIKLDPKYDDYDFPVKSPFEGVGQPGYLTEMQQAQIEQLRMMLEAEGFTKRLDSLTLVCWRRLAPWEDGTERSAADCISCSCDSSAPASLSWPTARRCEQAHRRGGREHILLTMVV